MDGGAAEARFSAPEDLTLVRELPTGNHLLFESAVGSDLRLHVYKFASEFRKLIWSVFMQRSIQLRNDVSCLTRTSTC